MEYIIGLIIIAFLGNFAIRYFVSKADRTPDVDADSTTSRHVISPPTLNEVLNAWGKPSESMALSLPQPIPSQIVNLLCKYAEIRPDEYLRVMDRSLAEKPFSDNPEFVQIGVWGDGSEVLVKRDKADERIYLGDIEDGTPERPSVLARSFEEYLVKAWEYYHDSLKSE